MEGPSLHFHPDPLLGNPLDRQDNTVFSGDPILRSSSNSNQIFDEDFL